MYQRLALIIFAVVLLAGQSGVLVHQHFCNDKLMAQRLFVPAPPCHVPGERPQHASADHSGAPVCPFHGADSHGDKNCCDDRAEYASADWEAPQIVLKDLPQDRPVAVAPVMVSIATTLSAVYKVPTIAPRNHAPPDSRLSPAWLQTYRC